MTDLRATQAFALAVVGPRSVAANLRVTQAFAVAPVRYDLDVRATQAFVLAIVKRRTYDPTVRAWTFTLDGHDFYVLRLGELETLVYDTHAEQWYVWGSGETNLWALLDGCNWGGGHGFSGSYGSNVLCGSDTNGALFFLDPDGPDDDNATTGSDDLEPFRREAMAQFVLKGYDAVPCWGVQLLGSIGDVRGSDPTDVTLEVSDDRGDTWFDCGTNTLEADSFTARCDWQSLGSISAPGRLFKIIDYGAVHRIDSLEMPG